MKNDGKFNSLSSRKNTASYVKPQLLGTEIPDPNNNFSKTMKKEEGRQAVGNEVTKNLLSKFNKVKSGKPPIIPIKNLNGAVINLNSAAASPPLRAVKSISTTNLDTFLVKEEKLQNNNRINATSQKTSKNLLNLLLGYGKPNDCDLLDSSFAREPNISKTSKKNKITVRGR